MPCTACTLRPVANGWVAECANTRQGPYLSKDIAFQIVASEALMLHRHGQRVRISVQDASGEVSAEYCLCGKFKFTSLVLATLNSSTRH
ncbi:MAG: hypothetical protein HY244_16945 [Rhizobiales bacterium]|nr:hypothetical protein [Hyphomicrobiales bacterium]